MEISTVIPTCNRKTRLLSLLQDLNNSILPIAEVIIVDSGEDRINESELALFKKLNVFHLVSEKSVCVQRNKGIAAAKSEWIFLCDDDIEVPADYLTKLSMYVKEQPATGAVSGLILQKEKDKWVDHYIERSASKLFWRYLFQLGYWGTIECRDNFITRKVKEKYRGKSNHLSKAGWPVLTYFSGRSFTTPVYGLGASLIKKEWLLNSPYDSVLDKHGIGDHYGVAAGFPGKIYVITDGHVYHHQEKLNRLEVPLQYYRRVLALDYFISRGKPLHSIKKRWLAWSLFGNLLEIFFSFNIRMMKAAFKSFIVVISGTNPYIKASKKNIKIVEPQL